MLSLQRRFSLKAVRRFAERLKTQLDLSEKTDLLISLFLVCFASYEKLSNRSHRDYRVDNQFDRCICAWYLKILTFVNSAGGASWLLARSLSR